MDKIIDSFTGKYYFLSNFFHHEIIYNGFTCPTNEHGFHLAKTFNPQEQVKIADAPTPGDAKRLGRRVPLRPDWEQVKDSIMLELLRIKFTDPGLQQKLLATGNAMLIEGNTWGDIYWGVCRGRGMNKLGKLLMQLRHELVNGD